MYVCNMLYEIIYFSIISLTIRQLRSLVNVFAQPAQI